jgi:hypothetical protein
MLCNKCVLPESKPDIWLDKEGICNICRGSSKGAINESHGLLESGFVKIIDRYRKKKTYDCLVMCSGGKDSTASLYYMKRRYKMNPLVFTFDNGFENEEAIRNIKNAVDILRVDWLFYKTTFIKDAFAQIIREKARVSICHICAIWYIQLTYDIARRYKIPLIISGFTKGQSGEDSEPFDAYKQISESTADFIRYKLRKNPKYARFPTSIREVTRSAGRRFRSVVVSPHWYLPWEPEKITEVLQRELKWRAPTLSFPKGSTNCFMNFVSAYLSMKHFGYTHYHIEASKLIRKNELSRDEALKSLEIDFNLDFLNSIVKGLDGCDGLD